MKNRYRKRRKRMIAWGLILAGVLIFAAVLDRQIYPIVQEYTAAKTRAHADRVINTAVGELLAETPVTYADLIRLTTDEAGNLKSAQVDSMTVNRIRTDAVGRIRQKLGGNDELTVEIPAGNLTGSAWLSGRGPGIPVKVKLSANVTAKVISEFLDAGINQTLHIIKLEITADVFLLLPTGRSTVQYTADYLLGQTVIVGDVPEAYTNVLTGEDDIEGLIEDFGADVTE